MRNRLSSDFIEGKPAAHAHRIQSYSFRKALWIVLFLGTVFLLVWLVSPDYRLFDEDKWLSLHTILETFSIVVSMLVFGIGWHSYSEERASNYVLLACAFLAVGLIDYAHVMSYPGMPNFITSNDIQKGIYFWLVARFLGSVALFSVALLPWKPFTSMYSKYVFIAMSLVLVSLIYWVGLFHMDVLPDTYIPEIGLTTFKVWVEYLIVAIHAVSAVILAIRACKPQSFDVSNLFAAVAVMGVSEICFTLYFTYDDFFNFLGHIYKIIAFVFLYRAIFVDNVKAPFRRLLQSEQQLQMSEEWLLTTLKSIGDAVIATDVDGRITFMNSVAEKVTGWTLEDAIGQDIKRVFRIINEETREEVEIPVTRVLREGIVVGLANHTVLIAKNGLEIPIDDSAAPIRDGKGKIIGVVLVFRDVTDHKQAEESQKRLIEILEATTDFVATSDADGQVFYYNRAARKMLGIGENEDLSSISIPDTHPEWAGKLVLNEGIPVAIRDGVWMGETAMLSRDGRETLVSQLILSHKFSDGTVKFLSTIARDITYLKKSAEKERLAAKVFENITEGVIVTDAEALIISVNRAFTEITGYSEEEAIGKNPKILSSGRHGDDFYKNLWSTVHETGRWKGEIWDRRKSGEVYLEEITINVVKDEQGNTLHYVAVFKDITQRKQMEEQIQYQAFHDILTDLPNRRLFMDKLTQAIDWSRRNKQILAVLFLDLDRFKIINDTLGHNIGDILLKLLAERLMRCIRENDTVSRLGGDEFIILLTDCSEQDTVKMAEKIFEALAQPFVLNGQEYFISTSIGISLYPTDGNDGEVLIKHADIAMYRAKEQRNHYQFFTPSMNDISSNRLKFENELRKALVRKEFFLHYQPKFDLNTEKIIGVEALIRWQHPELGLVSPEKFIPLAEETGLIIPIGEWVLHTACKQNKALQDAGFPPIRVAVNLSLLQFQQKNLTETIDRIVNELGLSPYFLELELTESIIMSNPEATIHTLQELKERGIHISLDDFGTGYSSLNYLKRLPLDTLKIDRSFVRNLATQWEDMAIVKAVIALAHNLNMKVITEGVETEEQLNILRSYQCDEIQGYVYSPPLSAEELMKLLRAGISESEQ